MTWVKCTGLKMCCNYNRKSFRLEQKVVLVEQTKKPGACPGDLSLVLTTVYLLAALCAFPNDFFSFSISSPSI